MCPPTRAEAYAWLTLAASYFSPEDQTEAAENSKDLAAPLAASLSAQQLERAEEIARNRREVIETRRKARPVKAGPGESET